jgi:hypothetical protein
MASVVEGSFGPNLCGGIGHPVEIHSLQFGDLVQRVRDGGQVRFQTSVGEDHGGYIQEVGLIGSYNIQEMGLMGLMGLIPVGEDHGGDLHLGVAVHCGAVGYI